MIRPLLALIAVTCCVSLAAGKDDDRVDASEQSPPRCNILFVYLDDFGWRDAAFMGSDFYATPNLDALASRSVVFTDSYAAAANCAPSRACLLTGGYTPRHHIFNVGTARRGKPQHGRLMHIPGADALPPEQPTWADVAKSAGYATASIGKWHLSDDPTKHGFDVNVGGSHSGSPPKGYYPPHPRAPGLDDVDDDEYLTDSLTDASIHFIDEHADRPWLLYLSHFAVHTPLQPKRELIEAWNQRPPGQLHDNPTMAAMIQSVDDGVGRILHTIASLDLDERTIVIFSSDNGGFGPATSMAPLRGSKGMYTEGGIRVPLTIHWPGVTQPGRSNVPVINVDLFPTLCDMIGVDVPDSDAHAIDGVSLSPILKRQPLPESLADRGLFWHFPAYLENNGRLGIDALYRSRPCGVIRHGDWKLIESFEDGSVALFNLKTDIGETQDLAAMHADTAERLHRRLIDWRTRTGAPVPTQTNPQFDADSEAAEIAKRTKQGDRRKQNRGRRTDQN